ncbi:type 1 fimbrial protein [Citrobacter freundii]|nr:type 1 fimbrial protein [Citrobacter freundii]MBC6509460.1 type 1 fimbrial protein [Citrobacter freundii]
MSKPMIASALTVLLISFGASAANQGQGKVNFKGFVIDAPCGISEESEDQLIKFGQVSKLLLASGGISTKKNVDIKLEKCDPSNLKKGVTLTFNGNTVGGQPTELLTSGDNTNTAIVLNGYGSDVVYGTPTDFVRLGNGDNTLRFSAWVKQATGKTVGEGEFNAVTNFSMSYE